MAMIWCDTPPGETFFAYDAFISKEFLEKFVGHVRPGCFYMFDGYDFLFSPFPNLRKEEGLKVFGLLYELSFKQINVLDDHYLNGLGYHKVLLKDMSQENKHSQNNFTYVNSEFCMAMPSADVVIQMGKACACLESSLRDPIFFINKIAHALVPFSGTSEGAGLLDVCRSAYLEELAKINKNYIR